MNSMLSLFVQPQLVYLRERIETSPRDGAQLFPGPAATQPFRFVARDSLQYLRFELSLPLVFHVSPSVGIGFGPDLWYDKFIGAGGLLQIGASTAILASF